MATITRPWMGANPSERTVLQGCESDVERFAPAQDSDVEQPLAPNRQESFGPVGGPPEPNRHEPLGRKARLRINSGPTRSSKRNEEPGGSGMRSSDGEHHPKSLKFWLIILSNFLAIFLVAIDRTILATAIPRITDDFDSQDDIGWYAAAYMLTGAASQLLFGRIYKFYDVKWTFLICIGIFEGGSIVCALAQDSITFIFGRAVSGLGSAGIFTGAMMIMIPMVPLPKRPLFQSMFGMVFGVSSVAGPLLGGVFTGKLSWRWCFWINLPMGALSTAVVIFLLKSPPQRPEPVPIKEQILRLDPLGTLFFVPSVVSLLLALQWGGSRYEWTSWQVLLLFSFFGSLFVAFCLVQGLMPKTATVPFRIISQRSIFYAAMFNLFLSGAQLIIIYFVPIWFQSVKRVDPIQSGVYTIPFVLSIVVSSIIAGVMTTKIGYYIPSMVVSPVLTVVGAGLMSTFNVDTPSSQWIGYQFLAGFGLGFGVQVSNLCAQTVLPKEDVSVGVSLMFFVQGLGGAIATALGQNILSNALVERLAQIEELGFEGILESGATDIIKFVENNLPDSLSAVIESYNYACTRIFFTAMVISFITLSSTFGMEWRSVKKAGPPGGSGGPPRRPSNKEKRQAIPLDDQSPMQDPEWQPEPSPDRFLERPRRDSPFSIPRKPVPSYMEENLAVINSPLNPSLPLPLYMRNESSGPVTPGEISPVQDARSGFLGSLNKLGRTQEQPRPGRSLTAL